MAALQIDVNFYTSKTQARLSKQPMNSRRPFEVEKEKSLLCSATFPMWKRLGRAAGTSLERMCRVVPRGGEIHRVGRGLIHGLA
jgi:hypothetical protein